MSNDRFDFILREYFVKGKTFEIKNITVGLINDTWLVHVTDDLQENEPYILQRINPSVFHHPEDIDFNIRLISKVSNSFLPILKETETSPRRTLIKTADGQFYRLYFFVKDSYTVEKVSSSSMAYEAAKSIGKFTKIYTNDEVMSQLRVTIPNFHNLISRYNDYINTVNNCKRTERIENACSLISFIQEHKYILIQYQEALEKQELVLRVIHHDSKISNVLFDIKSNKGLCVIDLDTTMPGYFISDLGDMFRSYLVNKTEESKSTNDSINLSVFEAIVKGYLEEMFSILTPRELTYIVYAGEFIIYMQLLRFLTDYLNGDIYFKTTYPDHNLDRSVVQQQLLQHYLDHKNQLQDIVNSCIHSMT